MRVTYYALRPIQVGDEVRQPGDLIPEANDWPYLPGYVQDGKVAAVLVVTLPKEVQDMLLDWEAENSGTAPTPEPSESEDESADPVQGDDDEAEPEPVPEPAAAPKPGAGQQQGEGKRKR